MEAIEVLELVRVLHHGDEGDAELVLVEVAYVLLVLCACFLRLDPFDYTHALE